jgi:hypothetical protein
MSTSDASREVFSGSTCPSHKRASRGSGRAAESALDDIAVVSFTPGWRAISAINS